LILNSVIDIKEVVWVWASRVVSWQRNCEAKDDVSGLGDYAFL